MSGAVAAREGDVLHVGAVFGTSALHGEGVFSRRPHLVPCNYGAFYSGYFTLSTLDATVASVDTWSGW